MINYKNMWLYGFWKKRESENEYIIYGVNKWVLVYGILIQTLILAGFLTLLFIFEGMWFLSIILLITTTIFINTMQKNLFWFNYNGESKRLIVLSNGFRTPDAIKGRFTMGKKNFTGESGYCER